MSYEYVSSSAFVTETLVFTGKEISTIKFTGSSSHTSKNVGITDILIVYKK